MNIQPQIIKIATELMATGKYTDPSQLFDDLSEMFNEEIDRLSKELPVFTDPRIIAEFAANNIAAHFDLPTPSRAIN